MVGPSVKLGGRVKADGFYDNNARGGVYALDVSSIPLQGVDAQAARQGHANLTANASRLSVEAKHEMNSMPVRGFIEMDFAKDDSTTTESPSPRIRHAYAEVGGLLVGQTWFTFSTDAYMNTLDNLYGPG